MQATSSDVQAIMELIRLEDTSVETASIIQRHIAVAEIYLQNAGIKPAYTNDLYIDIVAQFVGIKYDAPEGVGGAALFNPTFIGQIEQVRLALENQENQDDQEADEDP